MGINKSGIRGLTAAVYGTGIAAACLSCFAARAQTAPAAKEQPKIVAVVPAAPQGAAVKDESVSFAHADGETDLNADKVVYDLAGQRATADGNVRFNRESDKDKSNLTSQRLEASLDANNKVTQVKATGKVHIDYDNGKKPAKLDADECLYTPATQKAVCRGNVTLHQDGHVLTGKRLEADFANGNHVMYSEPGEQVRLDIADKPAAAAQITVRP